MKSLFLSPIIKISYLFESFKPFTTRNIRADGKEVHVTSRSHLARLCRENHVVPHPYNDAVESKADVREISQAVREKVKKFPARYRKLKEEVKALTGEQVKPIADRAAATNREERRA